MVSLQNVTIKNDNNIVLSNINFSVEKGEFVFLIGRTGTGKSSLLKILYGDLELFEGQGSIIGFDLNSLKEKQIPDLRRKLGVVFQDFKLLNDRSLFDNLSFVLKATGWKEKRKISERIDEVLEMVNVKSNKDKFPFFVTATCEFSRFDDPDRLSAGEHVFLKQESKHPSHQHLQ